MRNDADGCAALVAMMRAPVLVKGATMMMIAD